MHGYRGIYFMRPEIGGIVFVQFRQVEQLIFRLS